MPTTQAHQAALTKFIQAHMVMLGPRVIVDLVQRLPGIQITNTGVVNKLDQDPAALAHSLSNAFAPFGGTLTKRLHDQLFPDTPSDSGTRTNQGEQ
jgi:hypothetical protein